MPFHGLYHRIHSCYQGSNQFQAQKFHSDDHRDHIWPFLTIFGVVDFWSSAFLGRRPMHFRSNHDLNLWFSTVTLLWLIMRLLLSGIIEWRLSPKKTPKNFGGIQTFFFRQIIKLKNHSNKRYLGDNGRKCWYLFWSRRPYFLINFNFSILASLKIIVVLVFGQNPQFETRIQISG